MNLTEEVIERAYFMRKA